MDIVPVDAILNSVTTVESVREFEKFALTLPQIEIQTVHNVFGGMCARTIFIPAGVVVTGALIDVDNICISSGDITVTTDCGTNRLTGYHVINASSGKKRVGFTHADTYWTMIFKTDKTDIEEIEKEFTSESEQLQTNQIRKGNELCPGS